MNLESYHGHTEWQIALMLVSFYSIWMVGAAKTRGMRVLFFIASCIIVAWMAIHPYIEWLEPY